MLRNAGAVGVFLRLAAARVVTGDGCEIRSPEVVIDPEHYAEGIDFVAVDHARLQGKRIPVVDEEFAKSIEGAVRRRADVACRHRWANPEAAVVGVGGNALVLIALRVLVCRRTR